MALTRGDFEVIAEYIGKEWPCLADHHTCTGYALCIKTLSSALKVVNHNFDKERFADAIGKYRAASSSS